LINSDNTRASYIGVRLHFAFPLSWQRWRRFLSHWLSII